MRTVHVVVHPEATHHVDGVVGGWFESDLTPAGLADANAIAIALRAVVGAHSAAEVFSSDSLRAKRTAEPIGAALNTTPVPDRRLREKSYGAAEGRPQDWLDRRFLPSPAVGDRLWHDEGIAGAETKGAFAQRIYSAMDDVLARPAEHQVIVTHGFALTFVVAAWGRIPVDSLGYLNFKARAGSITTLHEDDYFHNRQVVRLCDTSHLVR